MTLHYYKKLIQLKQLKQNGNRNGMVCPSGTRDLPITLQGLPFFLVKISKVKYKIWSTITQAELLQLHLH